MLERLCGLMLSISFMCLWLIVIISNIQVDALREDVNQLQHQVQQQQEQIKVLDAESVRLWRDRMGVE